MATASETPKITIANVEAAEFENLGTTLEAIVNGTTEFGGATFNLKQFHFHTPSEHRINEEYFPLEMHMVHEAAGEQSDSHPPSHAGITDENHPDGSGGITVLAVLFQLCAAQSSTQLLKAVTENIANVANPGSITETGALDFTQLITHLTTTPLRQYTGSLTTPPCAEGLTFLVTERPLPLDVETYNSLKSVIRFNSRFTQNIIGDSNLLSRNGGIDSVAAPAEGEDTAQEAPAEEGNLLVTEIAGEPTSVVATIVPRATPAAVENSRTKRRRGQQLSL